MKILEKSPEKEVAIQTEGVQSDTKDEVPTETKRSFVEELNS